MSLSNLPPSALSSPEPWAPRYRLIEEEFADDDFKLLVSCIFLNRTQGTRAIPTARRFLLQYPNPEMLAKAENTDVEMYFAKLGLPGRATRLIKLAKQWLVNPPMAGKTSRKTWKGVVTCESEVAHLFGIGAYASDAWRIFCKDKMYESAGMKLMGEEWRTVTPKDKELRWYLERRWSDEGYDWNPETGIAVKHSSATDIGDLGMGNLTIHDSGKKQLPT